MKMYFDKATFSSGFRSTKSYDTNTVSLYYSHGIGTKQFSVDLRNDNVFINFGVTGITLTNDALDDMRVIHYDIRKIRRVVVKK